MKALYQGQIAVTDIVLNVFESIDPNLFSSGTNDEKNSDFTVTEPNIKSNAVIGQSLTIHRSKLDLTVVTFHLHSLLAPSGALIAIPTYY